MSNRYNPYLAKLFSNSVIREFALKGNSDRFVNTIRESGIYQSYGNNTSLKDIFEKVYSYLQDNYRSEYVYKNAIANKLLLGRHSVNSSVLLTEFRVSKAKADIVIINGTSSVYEIKTEYDNLNRITDQLTEYKKAFDLINVVTCDKMLDKLLKLIPQDIGVITLSPKYTLKTVRNAQQNKKNVSPEVIFDSLRKKEYIKILKQKMLHIPAVPNTQIYALCKKLFVQLSPEEAHDAMVKVLRHREYSPSTKNFIQKVPKSVKLACLVANLRNSHQSSFINCLSYPVV